ncbi:hypothetical protein MRX96_012409 [Rhipicephalus microplus]
MWSDEQYCSGPGSDAGAEDCDAADSEAESHLYSEVHYKRIKEFAVPDPAPLNEDEGAGLEAAPLDEDECPAPELPPAAEVSDGDDLEVLAVIPAKKRKRAASVQISSVSTKARMKRMRVTATGPGPSGRPEDCKVIVLSSDDEVIGCEEGQNLILNLFDERARGDATGLWHVDAEDLYRNSRAFRYYNKEKAHCRKCDQMGHVAKFCRKKKFKVCFCCSDIGHDGARCRKRMCSRCYEQGHTAAECKETDVPSCTTCYTKGHPSNLCPDLWRRYHMTTEDGPIVRAKPKTRPPEERYCYNCARQGHYGHQCQQKKRGRPSTPFVVSYKDIYRPEPPPLVLRDAKRLYHANNKRKRKNGRMKALQAAECNEAAECNGQAAHYSEQAGFHDQQTPQTDVIAAEGAVPPESNCTGEQVSEDAAPLAKRRKKSRMKVPNTMSKRARRKRTLEKNKQKKLSQDIKRKLFQGEQAQKPPAMDNTTFYIPNSRCYRTYWDHS